MQWIKRRDNNHFPVLVILSLFIGGMLNQSCASDAAEHSKGMAQVWLEKQYTETGWKFVAWLNSDVEGEVTFKYHKHIQDANGNSLTIRKHGKKINHCCNKKVRLGSFIINGNNHHKRAELWVEAWYKGKSLGEASLQFNLDRR